MQKALPLGKSRTLVVFLTRKSNSWNASLRLCMEEIGAAETEMKIYITDEIASQFLSGLVPILILIAIGAILSFLFKRIHQTFSFTRMALILALPPLSLINFIDPSSVPSLYLFAMIVSLFGITIDGINQLLMPKEKIDFKEISAQEATPESEPEVIVWEKAE